MCYDVSFSTRYELISEYLPGIVIDPQIPLEFNMTPHVMAQAHRRFPVIIFDEGQYKLLPFEWGVIPEYMDTPEKIKKGRSSMCNARSEKILEDKRSYWHRIRKKRCLVPVTGIFEHREVKSWKNKVPYHVRLKNRGIFCLPGLYHYPNRADVETGEVAGTFTVITRAANAVMAQIHNGGDNAFRMPLFLTKELEMQWLRPELNDEEIARILSFEMPAEEMEYHPVYTIRTTKERPDGKDKLEAYDWPGLPPLGMDQAQVSIF
jgi:putative SOS response-associated peptidase YedK